MKDQKKPVDDSLRRERSTDEALEIDYTAEGATPPERDKADNDTDRGYDQAARSGPSRYGVPEGNGGVFGTSGGGTYSGGFQVVKRPGVSDRNGEEVQATRHEGSVYGREADTFDQVNFEDPKSRKKND